MKKQSNKTENKNIAIQKVSDSAITLKINGEVKEIPNDIGELTTILEQLNSQNVRVGEKIYNIGEIGQAEFKTIINQYQQESRKSYYLRLFLFVLVPALAIGVSYLLYQYWVLQQPVVFTVAINNLTPHPFLPLEKAKITLVYGDKRETQEVETEAVFKGIPANFRGDVIKILFQSEGFESIDTSLVLTENHIDLPVKRNSAYAKIFGIVKDAGTGSRLEGVKISVQDVFTESDKNGRFTLHIPFDQQRKQQRVRANKAGYIEWDRTEPVIENFETIIRMQKKEQ